MARSPLTYFSLSPDLLNLFLATVSAAIAPQNNGSDRDRSHCQIGGDCPDSKVFGSGGLTSARC
jgi:hypothetical protein